MVTFHLKTKNSESIDRYIEVICFNLFKYLPTRDGEECSMCMICEELCPTGAMDAEIGEAEKGKCIVCLGCIAKCPDDVLKINDLSATWSTKLEMEKVTEESMKRKTSKLYF